MNIIQACNIFFSLYKKAFKFHALSPEEAEMVVEINNSMKDMQTDERTIQEISLPEPNEEILLWTGAKLGCNSNGEYFLFGYSADDEDVNEVIGSLPTSEEKDLYQDFPPPPDVEETIEENKPKELPTGIKIWPTQVKNYEITYRYRISRAFGQDREYKTLGIEQLEPREGWAFDINENNIITPYDNDQPKSPFKITITKRKAGKSTKPYCSIKFDDGQKFSFPLDIIEPRIDNF